MPADANLNNDPRAGQNLDTDSYKGAVQELIHEILVNRGSRLRGEPTDANILRALNEISSVEAADLEALCKVGRKERSSIPLLQSLAGSSTHARDIVVQKVFFPEFFGTLPASQSATNSAISLALVTVPLRTLETATLGQGVTPDEVAKVVQRGLIVHIHQGLKFGLPDEFAPTAGLVFNEVSEIVLEVTGRSLAIPSCCLTDSRPYELGREMMTTTHVGGLLIVREQICPRSFFEFGKLMSHEFVHTGAETTWMRRLDGGLDLAKVGWVHYPGYGPVAEAGIHTRSFTLLDEGCGEFMRCAWEARRGRIGVLDTSRTVKVPWGKTELHKATAKAADFIYRGEPPAWALNQNHATAGFSADYGQVVNGGLRLIQRLAVPHDYQNADTTVTYAELNGAVFQLASELYPKSSPQAAYVQLGRMLLLARSGSMDNGFGILEAKLGLDGLVFLGLIQNFQLGGHTNSGRPPIPEMALLQLFADAVDLPTAECRAVRRELTEVLKEIKRS